MLGYKSDLLISAFNACLAAVFLPPGRRLRDSCWYERQRRLRDVISVLSSQYFGYIEETGREATTKLQENSHQNKKVGRFTINATNKVIQAMRVAEAHSCCCRRVVVLVTLDERNTFNSARLCKMLKVLKSYFHIPGYLLRILGK